MPPIILQTPFGVESLYQPTLDAIILHLSDTLSPIVASFSSLPAVERLTEWILPTAREEWQAQPSAEVAYLEVTPGALTGFGFSVSLRDLPEIPPPSTVWECWGLAMAVAEALRTGMNDSDGVTVFPQYVENALNLAVGNLRVTVGLGRVAEG